jgi:hypothetical protein
MSLVVENENIRLDILRILYKKAQEDSKGYNWEVLPEQFQETLHIPENRIMFNLLYLEQKHLVNVRKVMGGGGWISAVITAYGIDIIERIISLEEEDKKEKPDESKVHKSLDWLKVNANWIIPTIIDLFKNIK